MNKVITRFAPSPTGHLHIGNARTALFNWLFAKNSGGQFLLRIEDTDQERSEDRFMKSLKDDLTWIGIDWDSEPVIQSSRSERHIEAADQLLKEEKAFKDDIGVLRFRVPKGSTTLKDIVYGTSVRKNATIENFALVRSDGSPTYHLSVVVDDHDMQISHVMRGNDHIANSAKQIMLYEAFGWQVPNFVHLPLLHSEDGKKLSKRDPSSSLKHYRKEGIVSKAMTSYLFRLGLKVKDEEMPSLEEMVWNFSLDKIRRSPSIVDFNQARHMNGIFISRMDNENLIQEIEKYVDFLCFKPMSKEFEEKLQTAFSFLKSEKTLKDILQESVFLLTRPKVGKGFLDDASKKVLEDIRNFELESEEKVKHALKEVSKKRNIKVPQVAFPLRTVLFGREKGPAISDIVSALGVEETQARLNAAIDKG